MQTKLRNFGAKLQVKLVNLKKIGCHLRLNSKSNFELNLLANLELFWTGVCWKVIIYSNSDLSNFATTV